MNRLLVGAMALALGAIPATAQSLEDLNIQIHGYATQSFLYTTNNNIFTTNSSNGSPAWTEAVVNLTAQPIPKLRVGVQARYFLLGNLSNDILVDWAQADYKVNDLIGVRFGKVKTPSNLFNETQDIDPSYMWALLPQSVYPLPNRDGLLSHYGGVVYGTVKLGPQLGKLDYRGWGGERIIPGSDGYWVNLAESGLTLPNGLGGVTMGAALHWKTPLSGLMVGGSDIKNQAWSSQLKLGSGTGAMSLPTFNEWAGFAVYEKNKVMVAGEYNRLPNAITIFIPGVMNKLIRHDERQMYAMASYKLTGKLTAGLYDSQLINHALPLGPARYSKDWVISGRYDFSQYLYAKAEEHFINGKNASAGYDTTMNPTGLKLDTKLTVLKIGVSF